MQGQRFCLKMSLQLVLLLFNHQPLQSFGMKRKKYCSGPQNKVINIFKGVEKTKWSFFISRRKGRDRLLCGQMHLKCYGDTKLLEKRADCCSSGPLSEDAAKNKSLRLRRRTGFI